MGVRLKWRRSHSHECCPEKLSLGIEIPGEDRGPGACAGVTSIDERIAHHELRSAIRPGLRVGPGFSVTIPRPHIDVGKLILQILKLAALFHRFCVEQLQILDVDDGRLSIHQQKTVVGVGAQRIGDPRESNRPLMVLETGDNAEIAVALFVFLRIMRFPFLPISSGRPVARASNSAKSSLLYMARFRSRFSIKNESIY